MEVRAELGCAERRLGENFRSLDGFAARWLRAIRDECVDTQDGAQRYRQAPEVYTRALERVLGPIEKSWPPIENAYAASCRG